MEDGLRFASTTPQRPVIPFGARLKFKRYGGPFFEQARENQFRKGGAVSQSTGHFRFEDQQRVELGRRDLVQELQEQAHFQEREGFVHGGNQSHQSDKTPA
jgi:hypothetical protein